MSAIDAFLVTWSRARDTFGSGAPQTGETFDQSGYLQNLEATAHTAAPGVHWSGGAASAYDGKNSAHAQVIGQLAGLDKRLGSHVTESAQVVSAGRRNLDSIRSWVLAVAQSVPAGPKRAQLLVPIVQRGLDRVGEVVSSSNNELNAVGAKIRQVGNEYARLGVGESDGKKAPEEEKGKEDRAIQTVDFKRAPPGQTEDLSNRRQNQIDAFGEVFGRGPSSATDWQTAAALDPHSYDPDTDRVPPEITVVRIRPVPGQGVVRVGQWIEQRDVISAPWKRDFGNTRPADPNFDPANTKVTTYIDYENGLVVMRQNPSVELTPDGGPGQVKVGIP
ncbi:EspA/EspE family type VII secretion system effector, partial [Mycolicibacterium doricum]